MIDKPPGKRAARAPGAAPAAAPAKVKVLDESRSAKPVGVPRLIRKISKKLGAKSPLSKKDPNVQ